jgi:hypothetical protein
VISHCPDTPVPNIGASVTVTWNDDISWQMVGLPMACGDKTGTMVGSFTVTAVNWASRTSTLQRTA